MCFPTKLVPVCHSDEHTRGGDLTVARVRSLLNFLKGKHSGHWHYGPGTGPVTVASESHSGLCHASNGARHWQATRPGRRGEARRGEGALADSDSHGALLKRRLIHRQPRREVEAAGVLRALDQAARHHPVRQRGRGVGWVRWGVPCLNTTSSRLLDGAIEDFLCRHLWV